LGTTSARALGDHPQGLCRVWQARLLGPSPSSIVAADRGNWPAMGEESLPAERPMAEQPLTTVAAGGAGRPGGAWTGRAGGLKTGPGRGDLCSLCWWRGSSWKSTWTAHKAATFSQFYTWELCLYLTYLWGHQ
jgi:hypothetical protein